MFLEIMIIISYTFLKKKTSHIYICSISIYRVCVFDVENAFSPTSKKRIDNAGNFCMCPLIYSNVSNVKRRKHFLCDMCELLLNSCCVIKRNLYDYSTLFIESYDVLWMYVCVCITLDICIVFFPMRLKSIKEKFAWN